MNQEDTPLLCDIDKTKVILCCGRNSVYNLVKTKELILIKMGRRSLITYESIREYVSRRVLEAQNRSSLDTDPNCIKARAARKPHIPPAREVSRHENRRAKLIPETREQPYKRVKTAPSYSEDGQIESPQDVKNKTRIKIMARDGEA